MTDSADVRLQVALAEIERLRARIADLEAINAMLVETFRATAAGELDDEPQAEPIAQNHPPSKPPRAGSREHAAKVREAIWQAYLAGERDYGALALRFGRTRGSVSAVIRDIRNSRAFGPLTAKDHGYRRQLEAAMHAFRMRTIDG